MYAIVDIETTGGYAGSNSITEIAIILFDGTSETGRFHSLVRPNHAVPRHIQALTGISDEMLLDAPAFPALAEKVFSLLNDRVFIAHNVNFDYSFIRSQLAGCGFQLQARKLCTVRMSRKIFPGLPSYGLGNLCRAMSIVNEARHRALGDAQATLELFRLLLVNDKAGHIAGDLKGRSAVEYRLPVNLDASQLDGLPAAPGVYYFKNQKGVVIYVGKALNLRKRVLSHFSGNNTSRQRQAFLRDIYHVDHQPCGSELMALILEASEIKRLWPEYNRAMKRFEQSYGLYTYEDQRGLIRLVIDKQRRSSRPVFIFNSLIDGRNGLVNLVKKYKLCPNLCFVRHERTCASSEECLGVCRGEERAELYNMRVSSALQELREGLPSFLITDSGRQAGERGVILMEQGVLYGMGYTAEGADLDDLEALKTMLTPYASNDYIRNLVMSYAEKNPAKLSRIHYQKQKP